VNNSATLRKRAGLMLLVLAVAIPAWRSACTNGSCAVPLAVRGVIPRAAAAALPAQIYTRDPLTEDEADQLREAAEQPNKRMTLLVDFATARMAKVDEARTSKPAAGRGLKLHDALDELGRVLDETDDNMDDDESRKMDMRKGLAHVIETDTEFQAKLAELKKVADDDASASDRYRFVLEDDIDLLNGQLQRAKDTMAEQERQVEEEKEREKQRQNKTYNPIPLGR